MPLIRRPPSEQSANTAANRDLELEGLASSSADERWAAARAAADSASAVPALAAALAAESEPYVREAIFTSLVRIGTSRSASAVLPLLRSDDAGLRTGALDALRAMPEQTLPHLSALLRDPDSDVRLLACELARGTPMVESDLLLSDLLDRETEANVCAAAVEVLAEIGSDDVLPALARCRARFTSDPFLGFAITQTIERIGAKTSGRRG